MLALVRGVDEIYAAKGRKVVYLDLQKERPDLPLLEELLLGPTGNLRAPTLRKSKTLIVGFEEGLYRQVFGAKK